MATLVNAGAAHYACTALVGTNKTGKLPKDENGYYTVIPGALDVFNGNGAYYPFETGKHIFEESLLPLSGTMPLSINKPLHTDK